MTYVLRHVQDHDSMDFFLYAAPRFSPVKLAASKKVVFFLMVTVYCIMFEQQNHPGRTAIKYQSAVIFSQGYSETSTLCMPAGLSSLPLEMQLDTLGLQGRSASSWGLIAFSALGPGAFATYLETNGQSTVSASQAQVSRL